MSGRGRLRAWERESVRKIESWRERGRGKAGERGRVGERAIVGERERAGDRGKERGEGEREKERGERGIYKARDRVGEKERDECICWHVRTAKIQSLYIYVNNHFFFI